jgi:hypothetical protein
MNATIVVNTFNPSDKGYADRQEYAMGKLYRLAPDWVTVEEARLVHDFEHDHASFTLNRDSAMVLRSKEHLPFVRELVKTSHLISSSDRMYLDAQKESRWFGFINNDTIVTEAFFKRLEKLPKTKDLVVIRVWDIPNTQGTHEPKQRVAHDSNDGILFRYPAYLEFQRTYPDMVLAAGWDTAFYLWAKRFKIRPMLFNKGECLHVNHEPNWIQAKEEALTTMYNRQMLKLIYNYDWDW